MMCGEWQVSTRQTCGVLELDRSTYHYKSCRPDQAPLAARIRAICETRVRYGYRRVQVLLRREGWVINQKRTRRIYNELGLQLRNKTPKRRVKAKLREDRVPATRPNDVWAMDFVHDQLAIGRKIRVLTVVDTFSRFSPVVDPRFSYRAEHMVATLESVCAKVGYPRTIRVDQGSDQRKLAAPTNLWNRAPACIMPDNAFIESFNGKFRTECLNTHWFLTLADAAEKMEAWLRYYNEDRPHGAIGHKPPIALQNPGGAASPPP